MYFGVWSLSNDALESTWGAFLKFGEALGEARAARAQRALRFAGFLGGANVPKSRKRDPQFLRGIGRGLRYGTLWNPKGYP